MKILTIKLTKSLNQAGPFTITDEYGNVIAADVSKKTLIEGISYYVPVDVNIITLSSTGECTVSKSKAVTTVSPLQLVNTKYAIAQTACLWRHLTSTILNNTYYNIIQPYILEYPVSYGANTEILQSIKDYSKVYKYIPDGTGVFSYTDKIETDDAYFNKMIVYNGQQSSGILNLVPKPKNNLQEYLKYPIYNTDSKTVTFTKSDGFYQTNGFYDVVKDKNKQLFVTSCNSLSVDKEINQENMTYTQQSFNKSLLRAKDVKVRYILDSSSDIHIVSMILLTSNQINYK